MKHSTPFTSQICSSKVCKSSSCKGCPSALQQSARLGMAHSLQFLAPESETLLKNDASGLSHNLPLDHSCSLDPPVVLIGVDLPKPHGECYGSMEAFSTYLPIRGDPNAADAPSSPETASSTSNFSFCGTKPVIPPNRTSLKLNEHGSYFCFSQYSEGWLGQYGR